VVGAPDPNYRILGFLEWSRYSFSKIMNYVSNSSGHEYDKSAAQEFRA
jgi:hypothetical protein